jgi:hypothetical protein
VGWGKGNIFYGGAFRFAKYGRQRQRKKRKRKREGGAESPQIPLPLRPKSWRAGVKKLKENCFALLVPPFEGRAETQSAIIRTFFSQNRFELRSVIATFNVVNSRILVLPLL